MVKDWLYVFTCHCLRLPPRVDNSVVENESEIAQSKKPSCPGGFLPSDAVFPALLFGPSFFSPESSVTPWLASQ